MADSDIRTGEVFPTYKQSGMKYYLSRTIEMAKRAWTEPDTLAHYTHRFTGLIIAFYIFAHIMVISQAALTDKAADDEENPFNSTMKEFHTDPFLIMDWLLWGAVSFHAFNGFRLILFDYQILIDRHEQMVWAVIGATLASMAIGLYLIMPALEVI